jgi:hypothetical protein
VILNPANLPPKATSEPARLSRQERPPVQTMGLIKLAEKKLVLVKCSIASLDFSEFPPNAVFDKRLVQKWHRRISRMSHERCSLLSYPYFRTTTKRYDSTDFVDVFDVLLHFPTSGYQSLSVYPSSPEAQNINRIFHLETRALASVAACSFLP